MGKVIVLGVVVLMTVVLFELWKKRLSILETRGSNSKLKSEEGFTILPASTFQAEVATLEKNTSIPHVSMKSVAAVDKSYLSLPIQDFVVKSSWNSARSGNFVSADAVKWVLSRGCRFLDFEVYFVHQAPYVAYSTDPQYQTLNSKNSVLLSDILRAVVVSGFAAPSPAPQDPLFVQLRMKTRDPAMYNLVGMAVQNTLQDHLYQDAQGNREVTGTTPLGDLMGKVVLITDQTVDPDYLNLNHYPLCPQGLEDPSPSCFSLSKFVSVQSGNQVLRTYTASNLGAMLTEPVQMSQGDATQTANVSKWRVVTPDNPDSSTNTGNFANLMVNYGAQIICQKYHIQDGHWMAYESFFNQMGSGLVPFSTGIPVLKKML